MGNSQQSETTSALQSNLQELSKGKEATKIQNASSYQEHPADKLSNAPGKDESQKDVKPVETSDEMEYDLELPPDSILTKEDLDEIVKIAESEGLNKFKAEKLIKEREELLKKGMSKAELKIQEKYKSEQKELMSHPDFIGDKKVKSFESIRRAVETFGDENLIKALNRPDIGNNLALALFLKKIGDMIASDSIEGKGEPAGGGNSSQDKEAVYAKLYPDFFKK
jgi:hypothetical protein